MDTLYIKRNFFSVFATQQQVSFQCGSTIPIPEVSTPDHINSFTRSFSDSTENPKHWDIHWCLLYGWYTAKAQFL